MPQPTYERLAELVVAQVAEIAALKARIVEQNTGIAELERRLSMNSKNSSKPLGSEGCASRRRSRCVNGRAASPVANLALGAAACGRELDRASLRLAPCFPSGDASQA